LWRPARAILAAPRRHPQGPRVAQNSNPRAAALIGAPHPYTEDF